MLCLCLKENSNFNTCLLSFNFREFGILIGFAYLYVYEFYNFSGVTKLNLQMKVHIVLETGYITPDK
jgi:hypothetical protein